MWFLSIEEKEIIAKKAKVMLVQHNFTLLPTKLALQFRYSRIFRTF